MIDCFALQSSVAIHQCYNNWGFIPEPRYQPCGVIPVGEQEPSSDFSRRTTQASSNDEAQARKLDFLSPDDPRALAMAAHDLADLASFAHSVSDNGQNPGKLIDAVKMLVLLQEEEFNTGGGVGGYIGLQNRFIERWGIAPACDPIGFLNTAYRLSLINRDVTVQLTTKGSRLLGSMHRLLDDWYAFHTKSDLEQLLFQSEREVELMESYEDKGYETRSLARALSFLERAYKDISSRTYEMIASGIALDQVQTMLKRYDFLLDSISKHRNEGFEPTLPILERVENAKAGALATAFNTMTGVLSHSTGRALSEMNPISRPRFYGWLREVFGSGKLLQMAADAGDVTLPVYLAGYPSFDQLGEFVEEFVGRSVAAPAERADLSEPTVSEEGDFEQYQGEFDEDFVQYVDLVLSYLQTDQGVRESAILRERRSWGDLLMTAAAAGEAVTKALADGRFVDEQYEDQRLKMIGDLSLSRRAKGPDGQVAHGREDAHGSQDERGGGGA